MLDLRGSSNGEGFCGGYAKTEKEETRTYRKMLDASHDATARCSPLSMFNSPSVFIACLHDNGIDAHGCARCDICALVCGLKGAIEATI